MSGDMYDVLFEGSAARGDGDFPDMVDFPWEASDTEKRNSAEAAVRKLIAWMEQQPPEMFED